MHGHGTFMNHLVNPCIQYTLHPVPIPIPVLIIMILRTAKFSSKRFHFTINSMIIYAILIMVIMHECLAMVKGRRPGRSRYRQRAARVPATTKPPVKKKVYKGRVAESKYVQKEGIGADMEVSDYVYLLPEEVPKMNTPPQEIPATDKHLATIIFLHGINDTASGWLNVLNKTIKPYMKIITPNANFLTLNKTKNGANMTAWFDGSFKDKPTDEGIRNVTAYIHHLIHSEMAKGIASKRIILGGHTQGAIVALHCAYTFPKQVGGVVAMSTHTSELQTCAQYATAKNQNLPLLMCDGFIEPGPIHSTTEEDLKQINLFFEHYTKPDEVKPQPQKRRPFL